MQQNLKGATTYPMLGLKGRREDAGVLMQVLPPCPNPIRSLHSTGRTEVGLFVFTQLPPSEESCFISNYSETFSYGPSIYKPPSDLPHKHRKFRIGSLGKEGGTCLSNMLRVQNT